MVRAKMRLVSMTFRENTSSVVKFETRYDTTIPEDMRFMKATPWGSIEMNVDNPKALDQFQLGKDYWVDFSAIDPDQSEPK